MIACEDTSQDHLYYVHTCGFGGLWRFAGPFNKVQTSYISCLITSSLFRATGKLINFYVTYLFLFFCLQSNSTVLETEMFANYLEAIVETILPIEEGETAPLSDLSTSTSMITLASPVDKGIVIIFVNINFSSNYQSSK